MAIFNSYFDITRGYPTINPCQSPLNPIKPPFSYGFPSQSPVSPSESLPGSPGPRGGHLEQGELRLRVLGRSHRGGTTGFVAGHFTVKMVSLGKMVIFP
jgi:hypothetical protein